MKILNRETHTHTLNIILPERADDLPQQFVKLKYYVDYC